MLSVIIPIRVSETRPDLIARVREHFVLPASPRSVEFIVVDDGSSDADYSRLSELTSERVRVVRTGAPFYSDFNLARARNVGALEARGDFLLFLDADLAPFPGFFEAILREIELQDIRHRVDRFLMCPVIYLTEQGSTEFRNMDPAYWQQYFINAMLADNRSIIEKYSSGTSAVVVERLYYFSRGGQDTDFAGWGYEDYEFTNRLIRRNRQFPLPNNWLSMAGNFMNVLKFDGWRSVYRLYGDWLAAKGLFLLHPWHPIEQSYHARKELNLKALQAKMVADQAGEDAEPAPLACPGSGVTLLLRTNPFCYSREFAPFLGRVIYGSESEFEDAESFSTYLRDREVSRVVFPNPYANASLVALYQWCREHNFPYVVCERGALPDSIFHDPQGFLNDSASYAPDRWDRPLSDAERKNILAYILDLKGGQRSLEAQPDRVGAAVVRRRLGIPNKKRVLFVPFQQPNDTVIRHFSGPVGSFEGFHESIARLCEQLGKEWVVVYKKHPAEDDLTSIEGAVPAHSHNFYDLIELADAVAVINSGVGIYAMLFGKPLFVFGDAWYNHAGLCRSISETEDPAAVIRAGFMVDYERLLRFVHYLRFEFYSFGKMQTRKARYADGSPITATTSIAYYELRGWSPETRYLPEAWKPIPVSSPLFDRYRIAGGTLNGSASSNAQASGKKGAPADPAEKGLVAFHAGKHAEASTALGTAVAADPNNVELLRSLAEAFYRAGEHMKGYKALKRAHELAPKHRRIYKRMLVMRYPWLSGILRKTAHTVPKPR